MSLAEIEPLVKAGADELYCAVDPLPSFCEGSLPGLKALKEAVRRAHGLGAKLAVAVNAASHVYSPAAGARLAGLLREADACGADAFIAANPFLPPLARLPGRPLRAKVHLSSAQPCFNAAAARFFIRLGVSRLILPTQLPFAEARGVLRECRTAGVETEIFDHRFCGCTYVNGRCSLHVPEFYTPRGRAPGPPCRYGEPEPLTEEAAALKGRLSARLSSPPLFYGAASFFDFYKAGVGFLKYGTRLDPAEVKVSKVREMREMMDLAGELLGDLGPAAGRKAFIERQQRRPAGAKP